MGLVIVLVVVMVGAVSGEEPPVRVVQPQQSASEDNGLANTNLIVAFVIFRHGDRTPDQEELDLYPTHIKYDFFPYGMKALTNVSLGKWGKPYNWTAIFLVSTGMISIATVLDLENIKIVRRCMIPDFVHNLRRQVGGFLTMVPFTVQKGKQRSYFVGKYIRKLYDGFISRLYLQDEIKVRTTDYARTQMTALTALSALYPPPQAQKWNPNLDWQPVPYDTLPFQEDDLLYWYNCPRYLWLRDTIYEQPEVQKLIEPFQDLFKFLSETTGRNITTTEDVFYLDNLFQTLNNVGIDAPNWAQEKMLEIKEVTKIEYAIELYNAELVQLAAGVLMQSILNTTRSAIEGKSVHKLYLYSAHENNVAALMAAARVFLAHQPNYGATFSLELRQNSMTSEYGIVAVYARDAGGPEEILPIGGCGGRLFCEYDKFVALVEDIVWSKPEMDKQCRILT